MKQINLTTLNIEGDKHLDLVSEFLTNTQADVVCLQEVFEKDIPRLTKAVGIDKYEYAKLMTVEGEDTLNLSPSGVWGVILFSRMPHTRFTTHYYVGSADTLPQFSATNPNSNNRAVVVAEFEHMGQPHTIATTHFTWALAHEYSAIQMEHADELLAQLSRYSEYILCGDFNSHRGEDTYNKFITQLHDNMPPELPTTLDDQFHRVKGLNLVVDYIFSTPQYRVSDVTVIGGLSDHRAITAKIERT